MASNRILLIESERANAAVVRAGPGEEGLRRRDASSDRELPWSRMANSPPDLLILDAASMKTSGARMSRTARGALNGVPIVLVAARRLTPRIPASAPR